MMTSKRLQIACFISPHGFGHAARMCALIDSISTLVPSLSFHIFTTTPEWFFVESLVNPFEYHQLECDIGLVQTNPIEIDHPRPLKSSILSTLNLCTLHTSSMLDNHASIPGDITRLAIQAAGKRRSSNCFLRIHLVIWIYTLSLLAT